MLCYNEKNPEGLIYGDVDEEDFEYLNGVFGGNLKNAYWAREEYCGEDILVILEFKTGASICVRSYSYNLRFSSIDLSKQHKYEEPEDDA